MNFKFEPKKGMAKWLLGIIAAAIVIYLCLSHLDVVGNAFRWVYDLLFALILGFIFALILNVPMSFLERHFWQKTKKKLLIRMRRPVALILAIVLILGALTGVVMLIIPQLIEAVKIIIDTVTKTINELSHSDKEAVKNSIIVDYILKIDWTDVIKSMNGFITNEGKELMSGALGTVGSLFGGIFDFFVAIIFSVYILLSKEKLKAQACRLIKAWIPEGIGKWFIHASAVASNSFRNFVAGQTIEALILGVLCMLGMLILRIPYAPTIGALVGATALIPVVGAFLGGGVGAFMIVTKSPVKALIFVLFLVLLQQIEGNLIYPKMMGDRIKLPAIWVLAAVTVGGGLAGPVGMLFAVPAMSAAYVLIREETEKRELKKMPYVNEETEEEKEDEIQ